MWIFTISMLLLLSAIVLTRGAQRSSGSGAQAFAESEFEKYRVIQDRLYESDFDLFTLPALPTDEQEE